MSKFEESNFYKALQDFFINADKKTFLQFLAEFYNRTEGIIDKNNIQDDLIKDLRELYLEFNEKGIDENIVREKVNYFLENSLKIKDIISKLSTNTNKIENIGSQLDTKANEIDLEIERKRINSFTSLTEGSTSGDAELIDGRIGDDYKVYDNIGSAIRGQFKDIKKDLYKIYDGEVIIPQSNYIRKTSMIISGTDMVDGKYTKALLEPQENQTSTVSIIAVNEGETYKISGDSYYNSYNSLGLLFSNQLWEDGYTNANRINVINGSYDYYCGVDIKVWTHFTDYVVTVPAGAKYMYVRGNETIKKVGQQLISKIPTKTSQLENNSNYLVNKYNYFNTFTVSNTVGNINEELYKIKNSKKAIKWRLSENSIGSVTFSDINLKCKSTDTVGLWVYLNKAITDRYTKRGDGNTIEGAFSVKFNDGEFDSGTIYAGYKYHNGWNYIEFSPNITELRNIIITFTRVYDDYELIFDSIELNNKNRTKIMLSFDNNQANLYNIIYPLLKERGFVGTYCLPSNVLANDGSTGVTLDNHRELMSNGWDYAYYGFGTRPDYENSTVEEWVDFFNTWKKKYENIGIGVPICYFSPDNRSDSKLIEAEKKAGFKMNRSSIGAGTHLIDTWDKDTFELTCVGISTKEGSSKVKSLIDEAIEKGKHLIIFIHQALENTTDTETVNVRKSIYIEVLDYLKAKVDLSQCDVITFREFYQIYEPNDYNEFMETRHNIELNYLLSK